METTILSLNRDYGVHIAVMQLTAQFPLFILMILDTPFPTRTVNNVPQYMSRSPLCRGLYRAIV